MKIKLTSQIITIIVIFLSLIAIACALVGRHYWIVSSEAYEAREKCLSFPINLRLEVTI